MKHLWFLTCAVATLVCMSQEAKKQLEEKFKSGKNRCVAQA